MPAYGWALQTVRFTETTVLETAAPGQRAAGDVLGHAGGHAGAAEIHANGGMLLPLLQGQGIGQLYQDVRVAEICVALVGNVLREIAKSLQRRQPGCGAAPATQGSRRARPAVIAK